MRLERIGMRMAIAMVFLGMTAVARYANAGLEDKSFRICVDREARASLKRSVREHGEHALYGYHQEEKKAVAVICWNGREPSAAELQSISDAVERLAKAQSETLIKKEVEAERKKATTEASRLKADEERRNDLAGTYLSCLIAHAKLLAVSSNEPADTIARAVFPACIKERQTFVAAHSDGEGVVKVVDRMFYDKLLLEVITARMPQPPIPPVRKPVDSANKI